MIVKKAIGREERMKRLLILGASGHIGGYLFRQFREDGMVRARHRSAAARNKGCCSIRWRRG